MVSRQVENVENGWVEINILKYSQLKNNENLSSKSLESRWRCHLWPQHAAAMFQGNVCKDLHSEHWTNKKTWSVLVSFFSSITHSEKRSSKSHSYINVTSYSFYSEGFSNECVLSRWATCGPVMQSLLVAHRVDLLLVHPSRVIRDVAVNLLLWQSNHWVLQTSSSSIILWKIMLWKDSNCRDWMGHGIAKGTVPVWVTSWMGIFFGTLIGTFRTGSRKIWKNTTPIQQLDSKWQSHQC